MKKQNIFKISWELSKLFWANSFLDLGWLDEPEQEPVRIFYLFVLPTFIITLIFILTYTLCDGLGIVKAIEWLFSRGKA